MIGLRDQAEGFQAPLKLRASAAKQPAATRPSDVSRKTTCGPLAVSACITVMAYL